jgi:hypothetical protein
MATRGASGLVLQPHWQVMGALEAADGMLLFGISTAFIFTVMQSTTNPLCFLSTRAAPSKPDKRLLMDPPTRETVPRAVAEIGTQAVQDRSSL